MAPLPKSLPIEFVDFLARLRLGDDDAIRSFVSKYEPFIRRTLRFRIARASLQTAADSVDVCQSVLGGFLLRLAAGDYTITVKDANGCTGVATVDNPIAGLVF